MGNEAAPGTGASSQAAGTDRTSGAGDGEEVARLRADNTRLRQQIAENEKLSARAVPLVRLAQTLIGAEGGKEIVEKLERGEPLTAKETKQVAQAEKTAANEDDKPLTKKEAQALFGGMLEEAVGRFGDTVAANQKASENIAELDKWAEKELEGYKHLKRDPQFHHLVRTVEEQVREQLLEVPEDEDVWRFITRTAHRMAHALHNEKKKPAKRTEEERVADALNAGGGPSSTAHRGSEEDLPEQTKRTIESIRKIGTGTIGRSFGNPQMNK